MEQLLLVNPRRHVRRRNARRSRKGRMRAALKRYWASKRAGRTATRLTNPRRHHRRRNPRGFYMSRRRSRRRNPLFRRHRRHAARRHHSNPRRHYRRLRNPRRSGGGFSARNIVHSAVVPAAIGAGGAMALDVVYSYVSPYLPATLQTGWAQVLVKGAAAVGLGVAARRFLGRDRGNIVMLGALTVTLYSALRTSVAGMGIPGLSGYSDYTPFPMHGLGAYMRGPTGTPGIQGLGRLGYVSPAATIGPTLSPRMGAYMPMNVVPALGDYGDGM